MFGPYLPFAANLIEIFRTVLGEKFLKTICDGIELIAVLKMLSKLLKKFS